MGAILSDDRIWSILSWSVVGPIASGVYGVGASIATGIGVKDYGQCSLPGTYILSGKQ